MKNNILSACQTTNFTKDSVECFKEARFGIWPIIHHKEQLHFLTKKDTYTHKKHSKNIHEIVIKAQSRPNSKFIMCVLFARTLYKKLIRRWDNERELSLRRHCTRTKNTIVSCINSATDRFLQCRFTKFRGIMQCNGHYTVQDHGFWYPSKAHIRVHVR